MKTRLWHYQARPEQIPPADRDWRLCLFEVGRGWGKTRAAAEWLIEQAVTHPGTKWAFVAPTWRDARFVSFEGHSGILQGLRYNEVATVEPATLQIRLANNSWIYGYSAATAAGIRDVRGLTGAWLDEPQAYAQFDDVWRAIDIAVTGRIVMTATPRWTHTAEELRWAHEVARQCAGAGDTNAFKKKQLVRALGILGRERDASAHDRFKELAARPDTVHVKGKTWDNAVNLSPASLAELRRRYEGTPEVEGAAA